METEGAGGSSFKIIPNQLYSSAADNPCGGKYFRGAVNCMNWCTASPVFIVHTFRKERKERNELFRFN